MQYPATHNSSRSVQEPLLLQNISFNGARKPAKSMHGVNKPRHTANGLSTSVSALPKRLLAALAGVLTLSLAGILYSYRTQHSELPIMGERDDDFYLMFHADEDAFMRAFEARNEIASQSKAVLLIKTGASVAAQRLSGRFRNDLSNSSMEYQVYSDFEQDLQGHHLIDVLADIANTEVLRKEKKLEPYRRQKAFLRAGKQVPGDKKFWDMDVYKNLPMDLDAVERFPDVEWYIHADADSYIFQTNLLKYLATLNPYEQHFLGATALINNIPFAHGGSGYVISKALANKAFVEHRQEMRQVAIEEPAHNCCGDFLLADSMYNLADVEVERPEKTSTKRFTGRHPQGVRFEEGRLCQPIYSLHHITDVEEEASLWRFEQIMLSKVNTDGLITFSDLFLYFAPLHLRRALKGNESDLFVSAWDNASDQDEVPEAKDVMACSKACLDHKSCIGWKFDDQGTCFRQPNMRIGSATAKPGFVSGWNLDRFRKSWEERPCR